MEEGFALWWLTDGAEKVRWDGRPEDVESDDDRKRCVSGSKRREKVCLVLQGSVALNRQLSNKEITGGEGGGREREKRERARERERERERKREKKREIEGAVQIKRRLFAFSFQHRKGYCLSIIVSGKVRPGMCVSHYSVHADTRSKNTHSSKTRDGQPAPPIMVHHPPHQERQSNRHSSSRLLKSVCVVVSQALTVSKRAIAVPHRRIFQGDYVMRTRVSILCCTVIL